MSNNSVPISPADFSEALKHLPLSTLHLKAIELRNSIAHLNYSNEQMRPFAEGREESTDGQPDQDCIDSIKENEIVIARMQERIALLRAEVEGRGSSWSDFQSSEELKEDEQTLPNGISEHAPSGRQMSTAWQDGTLTTGRFVNGEIQMNEINGVVNDSTTEAAANGIVNTGRILHDEALRESMKERIRSLEERMSFLEEVMRSMEQGIKSMEERMISMEVRIRFSTGGGDAEGLYL